MERLNKEGLAYYHSLIKGMLEVTPEDNEAITEMVLGTNNLAMYEVWLISFGSEKIKCVKELQNITGLGLKEAVALAESVPVSVYTTLDADEAELICNQLKVSSSGAIAEIKLSDT